MAASKRAKEARMKQQAKERRERELAARGITTVNSKANRKKSEFKEMKANETYRRDQDQPKIASLKTTECNTARAADKQYTGTFVKGVMETHKSNIVPVVSDEHVVAITRMRRG